MGIKDLLNWKIALIWHTIFFSLALLQQYFVLGMVWTIINVFVFLLLLRAVYGPEEDKHSNRGMAWYFYALSIVTDFLSLCIFGQWTSDSHSFLSVFILVMAVFILLPKPLMSYFLLKLLQTDGFDVKKGLNLRKSTMVSSDAQYREFDAEAQGYSGPAQPNNDQNIINDIQQQQQQQQPQQPPDIMNEQNNINSSLMDSQQNNNNNNEQYDVFTPP
eukprot:142461_1